MLFHDGDPGHVLYVILSGQVRLEGTGANGETVYLASRGRGDHFGELSLLDISRTSCRTSSGKADPNASGAKAQAGVALQITHQELADRIGTTRESVTRALGSLRKTGLIQTSGRTLVPLDLAALRRRVQRFA